MKASSTKARATTPTPTAIPTAAPTFSPPVLVVPPVLLFELLPALAAPELAFWSVEDMAVVEGVPVISVEVKDATSEEIVDVGVVEVEIKDSDDDNDDEEDDIIDIVLVNVDNVDDSEEEEEDDDGDDKDAITVSVETEETEAVVIWVTVLASGVENVDTPVSADGSDVLDADVAAVAVEAAVEKK